MLKNLLFVIISFISLSINSQPSLHLAEKAYSSKDWKKVSKLYQSLVEKSPYNGDFYYRIGRAYFMLENYDNSKKYFKEAIKNGISTNDGYAYYYMARIEAKLGNEQGAFDLLSTTIDYSPDYINIAKREDDFRKYFSSKNFNDLLGLSVSNKNNYSEAWQEELLFLKKSNGKISLRYFSPYK